MPNRILKRCMYNICACMYMYLCVYLCMTCMCAYCEYNFDHAVLIVRTCAHMCVCVCVCRCVCVCVCVGVCVFACVWWSLRVLCCVALFSRVHLYTKCS